MSTILLLVLLCGGQLSETELLEKLDADVARLLARDPQAEAVREAMELMASTNNSDRWTNYSGANKILRRTRSKASIPLLLSYMVRHVDLSSSHIVVPSYAETLTVLTGKEVANPYQYVADRKTPVVGAVRELYTAWWEPNEKEINTDIEQWTDEQLQVLAARLLKQSADVYRAGSSDPSEWRAKPTAYAIYHLLYYAILEAGPDAPAWSLEELHPKMVPALLASTGYDPQAKAAPARDVSRPDYAAVTLLAALRRNGELDELDEIAENKRQTAGARLTAIMALFRADEKLRTDLLLELAKNDKNFERRLVAILTLKYAGEDREVGKFLTELLDDENAEIRTAAVVALRGPLPPPAIPKLKQIIDAVDPPQAMSAALTALGEYKSREAAEALAGFMAAGLEDRTKSQHLYYALSAFETATGQRWGRAGANPEEFYREKAKEALRWWKEEGLRTLE